MYMENVCNNQCVDQKLLLRICISRIHVLKLSEKKIIEDKFSSIDDFLSLSLEQLSILVGRRIRTTLWNPQKLKEDSLKSLKIMNFYKINVIFYDSEFYPEKLLEIHDPPYALYYRGDIKILKNPCVSMVGTRRPSITGAKNAKQIAQDLAIAGLTIVSGLAFGIDTQSHLGALCAQGSEKCGKTIAVLGSSVDNITPSSNKRLAQSILSSGGLIISEYAPSIEVQRWHFIERNRIVSALSMATIVLEAPPGSGSLITAEFALEHNRILCFYKKKENISTKNEIIKENVLFDDLEDSKIKTEKELKRKTKRSIDDYIEEGAPTIESALDFIKLLNL